MPFITSDRGGSLHYEDRGSGHPLVFVHGWGMSGRVWKFQADFFESSYRVITIDLRGHGNSSPPDGSGVAMSDLAGGLCSLFTALDLRHATLVGWSLGAQVVLETFRMVRKRLSSLVLTGGTPRFSSGDGFEFGLHPQEVRGMALRVKRDRSKAMGDFFRRMFVEGEVTPEQNQRIVKEIIIPSKQPESSILLTTLETLSTSDQRDILPTIDLPVLLIHGAKDIICLPEASEYMAGRISDAELAIMDGCGHAPFMSLSEAFNRLLCGFLGRVYVD